MPKNGQGGEGQAGVAGAGGKVGKGKRTGLARRLFYSFLVLNGFLGSVLGWSVSRWPESLRIFPGQPLPYPAAFPITVAASAGSQPGTGGQPQPERSDSEKRAAPRPGWQTAGWHEIGQYRLEIRVGRWTVRTVDLEVVPPAQVIPGGEAIGVLLAPSGLIVSRHQPLIGIDGKERYPAREAGIEVGDVLLSVASRRVESPADVSLLVEAYGEQGKDLELELLREGRIVRTRIRPVAVRMPRPDGSERVVHLLGLLLQEPVAGVGTLSFVEPETGVFGALGHMVVGSSGNPLPMVAGRIVSAYITGVQPGWRGLPGEKIGIFDHERDLLGYIEKNTAFGIFGHLDPAAAALAGFNQRQTPMPVALANEVHPGEAVMLTVLHGREVQAFRVEIEKVARQTRPDDKGMVIRITDPRLLQEAGGIVQGMSGSPVIQEGKFAGVVTHVFVNDQTRGYGVLAEWMLAEAGLWKPGRRESPSVEREGAPLPLPAVRSSRGGR